MMTVKSDKTFIYALLLAFLLLLLLITSYFLKLVPNGPLISSIIIILFQVVAPIEILRLLKIRPKDFNIYVHNIDTVLDLFLPPYGPRKIRPDFSGMFKELGHFVQVSLLVLVPYAVLYGVFFKLLAIKDGLEFVTSINFPPQLFYEFITQIFVVAVPEEIFYRGFLQGAFLHKWPNRTYLFGLPIGRAILLTNIIFAIAHVASSFSPIRLLTFFPGVIFSCLVYKNRSLLSAILFHATCNILGQILFASIFLR